MPAPRVGDIAFMRPEIIARQIRLPSSRTRLGRIAAAEDEVRMSAGVASAAPPAQAHQRHVALARLDHGSEVGEALPLAGFAPDQHAQPDPREAPCGRQTVGQRFGDGGFPRRVTG